MYCSSCKPLVPTYVLWIVWGISSATLASYWPEDLQILSHLPENNDQYIARKKTRLASWYAFYYSMCDQNRCSAMWNVDSDQILKYIFDLARIRSYPKTGQVKKEPSMLQWNLPYVKKGPQSSCFFNQKCWIQSWIRIQHITGGDWKPTADSFIREK